MHLPQGGQFDFHHRCPRECHSVHFVAHDGIRHDLGNPAGFVPARVEFGLHHPKYGPALFYDLEALMENYGLERN